ncbi:hypothetical protein [Nocardia sp. R6R-6]|uniref:hypothetical protein n=1 Tax=Nocardia sp. R6R-6 TaxID=3459303 RepID=UPI00403D637D
MNTTNPFAALPTKLDAFGGDWPTVCAKCVHPGATRPRYLDVGPIYRCVSCGARWTIDLIADPDAPGVLRGVATPAA